LRTKRYTESEVSDMVKSDQIVVASVKVWDKFGDLGLTGVIILKKEKNGSYFIDTFLLSCRILSRGIEKQFFTETLRLLGENNININAEFLPTPKNSLVKDFYKELGFELHKENEDGSRKYFGRFFKDGLSNVKWIKVVK